MLYCKPYRCCSKLGDGTLIKMRKRERERLKNNLNNELVWKKFDLNQAGFAVAIAGRERGKTSS